MTSPKQHPCPFFRSRGFCDHKRCDSYGMTSRCGYTNLSKCPYLEDSESKLVNIQLKKENAPEWLESSERATRIGGTTYE